MIGKRHLKNVIFIQIIFKSIQKKFECDLKTKLSGKRLYPTDSV